MNDCESFAERREETHQNTRTQIFLKLLKLKLRQPKVTSDCNEWCVETQLVLEYTSRLITSLISKSRCSLASGYERFYLLLQNCVDCKHGGRIVRQKQRNLLE